MLAGKAMLGYAGLARQRGKSCHWSREGSRYPPVQCARPYYCAPSDSKAQERGEGEGEGESFEEGLVAWNL
jgi:hypothetical protein